MGFFQCVDLLSEVEEEELGDASMMLDFFFWIQHYFVLLLLDYQSNLNRCNLGSSEKWKVSLSSDTHSLLPYNFRIHDLSYCLIYNCN